MKTENCGSTYAPATASAVNTELMTSLAELFKLFGDSTRIRILTLLDSSEMCVCEISERLGMTESAVSHQLAILRQADLVRVTRKGKSLIYALSDDHVRYMLDMALLHMAEKERG